MSPVRLAVDETGRAVVVDETSNRPPSGLIGKVTIITVATPSITFEKVEVPNFRTVTVAYDPAQEVAYSNHFNNNAPTIGTNQEYEVFEGTLGIYQGFIEFAVTGVGDVSIQASGPSGLCLLYTSPSPRDATLSRMPSSA